jgi:hypothetical protein
VSPPAAPSGPDAVLVCDYVGRRPEAPVSALDLEATGCTVHYLIRAPYVRALTAAGYAAALRPRAGDGAGDVRAVLAYCTAAPIAQELAAELRRPGCRPLPLVLFDPEPVTAGSIRAQLHQAADKLGEALGLDAADRAVDDAAVQDGALRERPEDVLCAIRADLIGLADRAAARGLDDADRLRADATAIAEFYLDWFSHLIAGRNTTWPAWGGPAVQILSRDQAGQPRWPGAAGTRTVRLHVPRDDLLASAEARAAVLDVLERSRS